MAAITETRSALRSRDGIALEVRRWLADGVTARGVLVVAHGMGEHADRYRTPLEPILRSGLVGYALDHRGHGAGAQAAGMLGDYGPGGFAGVVADLVALVEQARSENQGLPVILLGHSMGSMIAQAFVLDHSELIDGLALSGSAAVDVVATNGSGEVDLFSALNSPFAPGRTGFEWLSRDEAEVDRYVADPLCGFSLVDASMGELFGQGATLADPARLAGIRGDLPVWIASGDADPLHSLLGAVEPLIVRYRAAGLEVEATLYPEARHEIFNESNRNEVVGDLKDWVNGVLAAP